jgi:hypothetical protein
MANKITLIHLQRSCAHLSVSGSGTQQLPSGVALPGAYDPDDTKGVSDCFKVNPSFDLAFRDECFANCLGSATLGGRRDGPDGLRRTRR